MEGRAVFLLLLLPSTNSWNWWMSAEDETAKESILTESALPWSVPVMMPMPFWVRSFEFHRNQGSAPGTANLEFVFQWWNVSFGKDRNTPLIKQVWGSRTVTCLSSNRWVSLCSFVRLSRPVGIEAPVRKQACYKEGPIFYQIVLGSQEPQSTERRALCGVLFSWFLPTSQGSLTLRRAQPVKMR